MVLSLEKGMVCRYFRVADITVQVVLHQTSVIDPYSPEIHTFETDSPGQDLITLEIFGILPVDLTKNPGKLIYDRTPWKVYDQLERWAYYQVSTDGLIDQSNLCLFCRKDYLQIQVYQRPENSRLIKRLNSLAHITNDHIWLAPLLSIREGFILHSSALILNGDGVLFIGPSEAGKSTIVRQFLNSHNNTNGVGTNQVEVLCDDRNIVRRVDGVWRVYGTWNHSEISQVSPSSAPLKAVFFLEQSADNEIIPFSSTSEIRLSILPRIIRPLTTTEWWDQTIDLAVSISRDIPFYKVSFNLDGGITHLIQQLLDDPDSISLNRIEK